MQQDRHDACSPKHRARKAVALIKKVGTELKSTKFAALAAKISMSSTGHFDAIIKDLEEQAKQLNAEEEVDLEKKEQCEEDRQKNTKIAKKQLNAEEEVDLEKKKQLNAEEEVDL